MPSRTLPPRPDLVQLKRQAVELRRAFHAGSAVAAARIEAHLPRRRRRDDAAPLALAEAQRVLAREHGFAGWPQLKRHVELARQCARLRSHPRFDDAVAALLAGDAERLRALVTAEPELVRARGYLEPPFDYFTGATLLHHVAGNPYRGPLPAGVVALARLLLDAGADVHAATLGPNGGTVMGLVITSAEASRAAVAAPLMDLLLARGARLDVRTPGALDLPLANHAPRAAEKMIALGAVPDLCAAAALGRLELLAACFDGAGRLRLRPHRGRHALAERDAIGLALLSAYVNGHRDAVELLLAHDGNWSMLGVNNGTVLHRAAGSGDLVMVQRLVARGADVDDRNNPFHATPLSWARHQGHEAVFAWMAEHCAVDLHDAVCFDLGDQARARLAEDAAAVDRLLDQWELPRATPLHHAARLGREAMAALLLEHGARPNRLAGDGSTALDLALGAKATAVARLLERHGAVCARDL